MRNSIRLRLTVWYVVVLASTLVALGLVAFVLMRGELYDWLDDTLIERSSLLAERVRFPGGAPVLADTAAREPSGGERGDGWILLDGSRRAVRAEGVELGRQPERSERGTSREAGGQEAVRPALPPLSDLPIFARAPAVIGAYDGRVRTGTVAPRWSERWRVAAYPVVRAGAVRAVVVVARDLRELHDVLRRLVFVLLALIPIALAGAGLGGLVLAGRALRPVDEITAAAAAISDRDLSQRLPVSTDDELGRLASTFNGLIERLAQSLERQRRFTADASHELRTPLAVIRALTSQQLMRPRSVEEYERAVRQIDEAAEYMGRLVSHLLTLARADAGPALMEREPLELAELLGQVCAQVGEASGRTIPVTASGPLIVEGDAVYLTGLFLNLVENAVKYTPQGSVEVAVSSQEGMARVEVRDNGVGIPAEHLPHVFERFYRVDKARAREAGGAGLGLAIGQWIAAAHGGAITAESRPGEGTTMTVTVPLAPAP